MVSCNRRGRKGEEGREKEEERREGKGREGEFFEVDASGYLELGLVSVPVVAALLPPAVNEIPI